MPENQNHPIFKEYEKRRNSGKLSPNLHNPTPASLRDECFIVYHEKGKPNEDVTLRAFFGAINTNEDYDSRISNLDIDKFRPLSYFLKGTSKSTNKVNVDLLKWLINDEEIFLPDPSETQPGNKSWYRRVVNFLKAHAGVTLALLFILVIGKLGFYLWTIQISNIRMPDQTEKCMYWSGYHYEPVSCDEIKPGLNIIPLDKDKLKRMRKIPFFLKVTNRDVGKLWRAKIDGKLAYFTDSGMHPVDTAKRLLPLSSYMVAKYETEKNLITNILNWTYYIVVLSLVLLLIFQIKRGSNKTE